jgi:hypothetical protein
VVATRIIARASVASSIMHDLGLAITHRGRDNVGRTLIHRRRPEFVEDEVHRLFRSLIHVRALELHVAGETDRLPMDQLEHVLMGWLENDHHENDPTFHARFPRKPANARIVSRIIQRDKEPLKSPE